MTTVIKTESRKTKCPCCGSNVDANDLGRAGLTPEILEKLAMYIHDGRLEETFVIAESYKRQMNPSTPEFQPSWNLVPCFFRFVQGMR